MDNRSDNRSDNQSDARRDNRERQRLFDEWARHYDHSVQSGQGYPFDGYDRVLDRILALAAPQPGMDVLELGVGTGNLATRFIEAGVTLWGLDFSNEMLAAARTKLPQARLAQADLLGEWPEAFQRRYHRVVSAYVFHEFDFAAKAALLGRLARHHLVDGGYVVIGDIAFPTREALARVRELAGRSWDEDEEYWVAAEAIPALESLGFSVAYEQLSSCGGVFVIRPG